MYMWWVFVFYVTGTLLCVMFNNVLDNNTMTKSNNVVGKFNFLEFRV